MNINPPSFAAKTSAAMAVTATLAACSGVTSSPSGGNASPAGNGSTAASQADSGTPGPSAGNPDSGDCLLGANGADVEVGIANHTASCAQWIQNLAGIGRAWYPLTQIVLPGSADTADSETMQQACDLTDGSQELYVEDAGGQRRAGSYSTCMIGAFVQIKVHGSGTC